METPDWTTVTTDYRVRETTTLREYLVRGPGAVDVIAQLDECFTQPLDPQDVRTRVAEAFRVATGPLRGLATAFYVHARSMEAWETSTELDLIKQVVAAAAPALIDPLLVGPAPEERRLTGLVLAHTQVVSTSIDVEGAMNCSCPVAVEHRAGAVVAAAVRTLADLPDDIGLWQDARDHLHMIATTDHAYFSRIRAAAEAMLATIDEEFVPRADARRQLAAAITELTDAQHDAGLDGDVYESELRAHRLALQALAEGFDRPRIEVGHGGVTYLYPFTLARTVSGSPADWLRDHRDVVLGWRLCGLGPVDVRVLGVNDGLTDLFKSTDSKGRAYRGVRLLLPPMSIETTAGDTLSGEVEIRVSELGNHHLRVSVDIPSGQGHPHYLNQALRRGSDHMGAEKLVSGGTGQVWRSMVDYAHDLTDALDALLRRHCPAPIHGAVDEVEHGPHHVIMTIRELSLVDASGVHRDALGTDLLREDVLGGSIFWQPVSATTVALEEWLRYARSDVDNLVGRHGFDGELVLQTVNTTIIAMPGTPSWMITEYEEAAEFVATLRSLLDSWRRQVIRCVFVAENAVHATDATGTDLEVLEKQQAELRRIRLRVQSELALLKSPALCQTAVQRAYLDRLWSAASLDSDETDLMASIQEAGGLYDDLVAVAATVQSRREAKLTTTVARIATVVGLTGLAGFFDLINNGFGLSWPYVVGEIVVIAAILAYAVFAYRR